MSYETLDVRTETDSLWVTLNRPGRRNGLRGRTVLGRLPPLVTNRLRSVQ